MLCLVTKAEPRQIHASISGMKMIHYTKLRLRRHGTDDRQFMQWKCTHHHNQTINQCMPASQLYIEKYFKRVHGASANIGILL
jgi:hypothetical protein